MRRLYLESPIITDDAIILLKEFCQTGTGALAGVNLMKDLVMKRPTKQLNFLNSILEFCSHEDLDVRNTALGTVTQLFDRGEYDNIIEEYSVMYLRYVVNPPNCHENVQVPVASKTSRHVVWRRQGPAESSCYLD